MVGIFFVSMVGIFFSRFLPFSRKYSNKNNGKEKYEREKAIKNRNMDMVAGGFCTTNGNDHNDNDLKTTILSELRHELVYSAQALESDMDFAFDLQMQEAMSASLALLQPSTSLIWDGTASIAEGNDMNTTILSELRHELMPALALESDVDSASLTLLQPSTSSLILDGENLSVATSSIAQDKDPKTTKLSELRHELVSAQALESDIDSASLALLQPSTSLILDGENLSVATASIAEDVQRVEQECLDSGVSDSSDSVIIETAMPLIMKWTSRQYAKVRALFNGALSFDFKRLGFFVDYIPSFQYDMRRWTPKLLQITTFVTQVFNLQKKFSFCPTTFVAPNDNKFAFKLAREAAVVSQITGTPKVTCVICLEETDVGQIFPVDGCLHRYCFLCMKRHVEAKLFYGMLPKCPHEGCKSELNIDSCRQFLTPTLIEIMDQRLKEAAIPATEKVYCPYPMCSALMSKTDLREPDGNQIVHGQLEARRCTKCSRIFCTQCKVPWHYNMACVQYNRFIQTQEDDAKLKSLSIRNSWRQCAKCNYMIERAKGCHHMTCRCGYEFCYICGKEWKGYSPTCRC